MHYAEFAEDEVGSMKESPRFHSLEAPQPFPSHSLIVNMAISLLVLKLTGRNSERESAGSYQGVRGQQVESNWAESWKACQGERNCFSGSARLGTDIQIHQKACEQYAKEHFKDQKV